MNHIQNFYTNHPYPYCGDHNHYFERNIFTKLRGMNPNTILEAGCGTGGSVASIAQCYPKADITAVDFSDAALDIAKKTHGTIPNITFAKQDLTQVQDLNKTFDFINCHGVLHYIPDAKNILKQFRNMLTDGGYCHIWVFNPYGRKGIDDLIALERLFSTADCSEDQRIRNLIAIRKQFSGTISDEDATWYDIKDQDTSLETTYRKIRLANRYFLPEHPQYYSTESASELFSDAGFQVLDVLDFVDKELPKSLTDSNRELLNTPQLRWKALELLTQPFGLSYLLKKS